MDDRLTDAYHFGAVEDKTIASTETKAESVRTAHWQSKELALVCSSCGFRQYWDVEYLWCPMCGAKMMDGGSVDD